MDIATATGLVCEVDVRRERIARQGFLMVQVRHARAGESRSASLLFLSPPLSLLLPLALHTYVSPRRRSSSRTRARLCMRVPRVSARNVDAPTARFTTMMTSDVDTYTYIGSRRVEILLFLRLYEPYRRLLRLFRFNDRYPDSDGDLSSCPNPRGRSLVSAFGGIALIHPSLFFSPRPFLRGLLCGISGNLSH